MRLTYRRELMKQTSLARYYAETSKSFYNGNGNGENSLAAGLHGIIRLTFACFAAWVKPLFSRAEPPKLSPIQEYDPYVRGLARYLQGLRMD